MVHGKTISLDTAGFSDIQDITPQVRQVLRDSGLTAGLVCVFNIGSTGSITTIEFEPALVEDMKEQLERFLPRTTRSRHSQTWGDDNGFSHMRATFMGPQLTVPFQAGELQLGTWQQIVVIDHDNRPRHRKVFVQVLGE
jgi:secondary thiamine-phosphate synthase enzyme